MGEQLDRKLSYVPSAPRHSVECGGIFLFFLFLFFLLQQFGRESERLFVGGGSSAQQGVRAQIFFLLIGVHNQKSLETTALH